MTEYLEIDFEICFLSYIGFQIILYIYQHPILYFSKVQVSLYYRIIVILTLYMNFAILSS